MAKVYSIGDAQTDAAIASWSKSLKGKAAAIRSKYANVRPPRLALLADVDRWWKVAKQFADQAPSLSSITPARIQQAKDNATTLQQMRLYLKTTNFGPAVPSGVVANAVDAMTAPIDWLVGTGTPALETEANYADMIRKVATLDVPWKGIAGVVEKVLVVAVVGGIAYTLWKVHHGK